MAQGWTFVSNHGHVLVALATDPDLVLREVAARVGITERAVQQIVADLETAGYLTRERVGRRNRYTVREDLPFRHPLEAGVQVGSFLDLVRAARREDGAQPGARRG
jgi:DNA-binding IclR family transcriptional regulator